MGRGIGFRVWDFGILGFRVWGLGFRVLCLGFRMWGFMVWDLRVEFWSVGFENSWFGV